MMGFSTTASGLQGDTLDEKAVLRRHGRSFYFAGQFLGASAIRECAILYAFCRYVDDAVDLADCGETARETLFRIRTDLQRGRSSIEAVAKFIHLSASKGLDHRVTEALLSGVESDLNPCCIADKRTLLRYAYKVAGTVGIHMACILGTQANEALYHAIDLGIGMQLTNIARDVLEDAQRERIYLPASSHGGLSCARIQNPNELDKEVLRDAVKELLDLADIYYRSGEAGIGYLRGRVRFGIFLASRLYHAIGLKIRRRNYAVWNGRVYVTNREKFQLLMRSFMDWSFAGHGRIAMSKRHNAALHEPLFGLPFSHVSPFVFNEPRV